MGILLPTGAGTGMTPVEIRTHGLLKVFSPEPETHESQALGF